MVSCIINTRYFIAALRVTAARCLRKRRRIHLADRAFSVVRLLSALRDRARNWISGDAVGKGVVERRVTFTWNRNKPPADRQP